MLALGLGVALGIASRAAHASIPAAPLDANITWSGSGVPHVTARGSRLADDALRVRLASGLRTTLVVHVVALEGGAGARAHTTRACGVVFDEWERRYDLRVEDATVQTDSVDDALARCLDLDDMAIGDDAAWRAPIAGPVTFALGVALNPLTRRLSSWLARSGGGTGEPTFFGAWLGPVAFTRRSAERTLGTRVLRTRSGGHGS